MEPTARWRPRELETQCRYEHDRAQERPAGVLVHRADVQTAEPAHRTWLRLPADVPPGHEQAGDDHQRRVGQVSGEEHLQLRRLDGQRSRVTRGDLTVYVAVDQRRSRRVGDVAEESGGHAPDRKAGAGE